MFLCLNPVVFKRFNVQNTQRQQCTYMHNYKMVLNEKNEILQISRERRDLIYKNTHSQTASQIIRVAVLFVQIHLNTTLCRVNR